MWWDTRTRTRTRTRWEAEVHPQGQPVKGQRRGDPFAGGCLRGTLEHEFVRVRVRVRVWPAGCRVRYPHEMPRTPPPPPAPLPPRGVPRWLFPPPGAHVTTVVIQERVDEFGHATYRSDVPVDPLHRNALKWLLDEHERGGLPPTGCPFDAEIRLAIARTDMPGGRVGHAYALNDGPLGDPGGTAARGVLWRFVHAAAQS